jgi:hypothetical protein
MAGPPERGINKQKFVWCEIPERKALETHPYWQNLPTPEIHFIGPMVGFKKNKKRILILTNWTTFSVSIPKEQKLVYINCSNREGKAIPVTDREGP